MVIYKATNVLNGKVYIGQTIQKFERRRDQHLSKAKKGHNSHLSNSINKYGKENFSWEIIDTALELKELNKKEELWINYYKSFNSSSGYNVELGGGNRKVQNSTKLKLSISAKKRGISKEQRKIMARNRRGKNRFPMSPETKRKISIANSGKKRTDKTKQRLREIATGKTTSPETRLKLSLCQQGEKCYAAKITEIQAIKILSRLKAGEKQSVLAREYHITDGAIYRLKKGLSWRHLKRC